MCDRFQHDVIINSPEKKLSCVEMSKESKNKKRAASSRKSKSGDKQHSAKKYLTPEERARVARDQMAKRPVIVFRKRNGKLNLSFIIMLVIFICAMAAALVYLSRY